MLDKTTLKKSIESSLEDSFKNAFLNSFKAVNQTTDSNGDVVKKVSPEDMAQLFADEASRCAAGIAG